MALFHPHILLKDCKPGIWGSQKVQITGSSLVLDRISGGGRACVSSKRNSTYAHQTQHENQPCLGAAVGDSTPNLTKTWQQMTDEDEALDYVYLKEEIQLTKAKFWSLLGSLHATLAQFTILKTPCVLWEQCTHPVLILSMSTEIGIAQFPGHKRGCWIPIRVAGGLGGFLSACRNIPQTPALFQQATAQHLLYLAQSSVSPQGVCVSHVLPVWKLVLVCGLSFVVGKGDGHCLEKWLWRGSWRDTRAQPCLPAQQHSLVSSTGRSQKPQLPSQLCSSLSLQLWPSGWPWAPCAGEGEVGSAPGPG